MADTLSSNEAAKILNLSRGFLTSHLLQPGIIKAEKVNGRWQIDQEAVESYQKPAPKSKVAHTKNVNFVSSLGYCSEEEREANRVRLAEKIEAAKTAVLLDRNGGQKVVKRAKE